REFLAAARALRRLLLLDPDRRRVLRVESVILSAPAWPKKAQNGPAAEDPFLEWITSLEVRGRELANHVGFTPWLEVILGACKTMRSGTWPSDLALASPAAAQEMPWLARFERRERILPLLKGSAPAAPARPALQGEREEALGP